MRRIDISTPKYPNSFTLVDDEDFEWLSQWKWYVFNNHNRGFYAVRQNWHNGKSHLVIMHRLILGAKAGQEIDHRNRNSLDNQRHNLRFCTRAQNQHNQKIRANYSSQYKRVYWCKSRKKWRAQIGINGKSIHIGNFITEIEAAKAYDKKAKELFGEFAHTNF